MKYLKIALFTFNLLIWLAGCTVLVIGAWLLLEPSKGHILNLFVSDVKPHETINLIAYSLLGLGFIVLTVGFFGCRAALRGNQCILATYMSMLVALIVTELVTAAIGGLMTFQILSDLEQRLTSKLKVDYGHDLTSDIPFSQSLDFAQYKFNCCGIHGDDDYNDTAWWRDGQISGSRRQVPLTCCVLKNSENKNTGSPMSVVSRVFHKNNEKPWLHPQPRDEAACQVKDEEGHEGYRHKEVHLYKNIIVAYHIAMYFNRHNAFSGLPWKSYELAAVRKFYVGVSRHGNGRNTDIRNNNVRFSLSNDKGYAGRMIHSS